MNRVSIDNRISIFVVALACTSSVVGCGSPTFTLGAPPAVPAGGGIVPPAPPEASQGTVAKDPGSVTLEVHKTREMPDLKGPLVGLVPLRSIGEKSAERFEGILTVGLLDKGVNRIIPGYALALVQGELARDEGGKGKGNVKLSAPLASLALVGRPTQADFLIYGDMIAGTASEEREVGYSLDKEAFGAYQKEYFKFTSSVNGELNQVNQTCTQSLGAYDAAIAEFLNDGGVIGVEPAGQNAAKAKEAYAAFAKNCEERKSQLQTSIKTIPEPALVQSETGRKRAKVKVEYTAVNLTLLVRDSATDETVWLGKFSVKADSLDEGVALIAQRAAQELTVNVGTALTSDKSKTKDKQKEKP